LERVKKKGNFSNVTEGIGSAAIIEKLREEKKSEDQAPLSGRKRNNSPCQFQKEKELGDQRKKKKRKK